MFALFSVLKIVLKNIIIRGPPLEGSYLSQNRFSYPENEMIDRDKRSSLFLFSRLSSFSLSTSASGSVGGGTATLDLGTMRRAFYHWFISLADALAYFAVASTTLKDL